MELEFQQAACAQLKQFAESDKHSVIIHGIYGCGKTHLARQYAKMLGISDFVVVEPNMADVHDTMESLVESSNRTCICIENLDLGMLGVSYSILKFIEEPKSNIYIVITCRQIDIIPDTILSRCVSIGLSSPTQKDIELYCKTTRFEDYIRLKTNPILGCVKTLSDVDTIMDLNADKLDYFANLDMSFRDTVSNISYAFTHYPDKSKTPLNIVLRWVYNRIENSKIREHILTCLDEINAGRIADWYILCNMIFKCKRVSK